MHNIHNLQYSSVCSYDMSFDMKSESPWGFSQQQ